MGISGLATGLDHITETRSFILCRVGHAGASTRGELYQTCSGLNENDSERCRSSLLVFVKECSQADTAHFNSMVSYLLCNHFNYCVPENEHRVDRAAVS